MLGVRTCTAYKIQYKITIMEDYCKDYNSRINDLKVILSTIQDKNSVLTRAIHYDVFDRVEITKFCQESINKTGNADFDMICLIRLLYYEKTPDDIKEQIIEALKDFPFWPHSSIDGEMLKKVVFWSENHAFMLLSSGYLFRQFLIKSNDPRCMNVRPTELEYQLLTCFLRVHVQSSHPGLFEVLSFVYLPYTLMSLINVIEFSMDSTLVEYSRILADMVVHQMMRVTSKSGVCSIAVAARTYKRFRLRTYGHNVNHFIYCMTGKHPDKKHADVDLGEVKSGAPQAPAESDADDEKLPEGEILEVVNHVTAPGKADGEYLGTSRIGDFMCCVTGYTPSKACFDAYANEGFTSTVMNPSISELKSYLDNYTPEYTLSAAARECGGRFSPWTSDDLPAFKKHLIPLYWSAGLLVHPSLAVRTKAYVEEFCLQHNVHLWPLAWISSGLTDTLSHSYEAWTTGQCYVGIRLNVYKHDELLLTSFEKFNGGTCGYQQLPWIANIDGIGVWTQSGRGGENVGGFDVTNTHTPHVSQKGHLLVAVYSKPDALKSTFGLGALFNSDVRLFWCPSEMCQIVEKTLEEKDAKKKHAKGFLNSVKNMLAPSDKIKGAWGKNSWWLAERNECFIGVCCTGKTYASSSNSKDAKFELKKGSVVKMRNRTCKDTQHAWICCVGAKDSCTRTNNDPNSTFPLKTFESFEQFKAYCIDDIAVSTNSVKSDGSSGSRASSTYVVRVSDKTNSLYDMEVSI